MIEENNVAEPPKEKYKRYKNKEARKAYNREYQKKYMQKYRLTHPNYIPNRPHYYKETRFRAMKKIAEDKNGGKVECMQCGFDKEIDVLEINHINGNGRKEIKKNRIIQFYRDITHKKRNTNDLDIRCKICNIAHHVERKYGYKYIIMPL